MKQYTETRRIQVQRAGHYFGDGDHPDCTYDAVIEITVDIDQVVASMGRKAVLSKGKKSVDGAVSVRAHSVERVP
jgi:hypothetical protein